MKAFKFTRVGVKRTQPKTSGGEHIVGLEQHTLLSEAELEALAGFDIRAVPQHREDPAG